MLTLVLSLFVSHLFFVRCLGKWKAFFREWNISWVYLLIYVQESTEEITKVYPLQNGGNSTKCIVSHLTLFLSMFIHIKVI